MNIRKGTALFRGPFDCVFLHATPQIPLAESENSKQPVHQFESIANSRLKAHLRPFRPLGTLHTHLNKERPHPEQTRDEENDGEKVDPKAWKAY